jgi:hypothetical protein
MGFLLHLRFWGRSHRGLYAPAALLPAVCVAVTPCLASLFACCRASSACLRKGLLRLDCKAPSVSQSIWQVVCLAALSAVDYGRRRMWALHLAASHNPHTHPGLRQLTMFEAWDIPEPHPHLTPVQRASQAAVASFWRSLHSFVHFHKTPSAPGRPLWPSPEHLRASHPFLCHGVADGSPRLSLSGAPTR